MAKVKGPLFSLSASGKLADTLVYMTWKGIQDVRKWLKPANPNTENQQVQRGYLTSAVAYWHSVIFVATDRIAWNLLATVAASPMSGFNRFIKNVLDMLRLAKTYTQVWNFANVAGDAQISVFCDCGAAGKTVYVRYGTSKTAMINTIIMVDDADNSYSVTIPGLSNGVLYYTQCYMTLPEAENMNMSGIGEVTPVA